MTLQASGTITMNQIDSELDVPGNSLSLGSAISRWLAEVPSGPIAMSNFYSKRALKWMGHTDDITPGTGFSASMSFGPAFTGRVMIACICARSPAGVTMPLNVATIAGTSIVTADLRTTENLSAGVLALRCAIGFCSKDTGTSGTVALTFGSSASEIHVSLFAGVNCTVLADSWTWNENDTDGIHAGQITPGIRDLVIQCTVRNALNDVLTLVGTNVEDFDGPLGSAAQVTIGSQNGLSAETNRPIGYTAGTAVRMAFVGIALS